MNRVDEESHCPRREQVESFKARNDKKGRACRKQPSDHLASPSPIAICYSDLMTAERNDAKRMT